MEKKIREEARELPIAGDYDVLVAGGGIAGIAAALSAARAGARTLLIEREYLPGGLATLGLVTIYLPLCDGCGHQVSYDIAEELLRLSIADGAPATVPQAWLEPEGDMAARATHRYEVQYDPHVFAVRAEQLLTEAGVTLLYGTTVTAAFCTGDQVCAVALENKDGRTAVRARAFVDCTGDADLCALCGEETATFAQGNVLAAWYYETRQGQTHLHMLGYCDVPERDKTPENAPALLTPRRYSGLSAAELSEQVMASHARSLQDFLKAGGVSPTHALATLPTVPQVRMTRRLCGGYTMQDGDDHVAMPDSVGLFSDWRKRGPVYELPFRALHGRISNLFVAGRCLSAEDAMWDITRVIPVCAVSGEAAGAAAALGTTDETVHVLQAYLQKCGVRLHLPEVLPEA